MGRFRVIAAQRTYQHIAHMPLLPQSNASGNASCPQGHSRGTQKTRKDKDIYDQGEEETLLVGAGMEDDDDTTQCKPSTAKHHGRRHDNPNAVATAPCPTQYTLNILPTR